jgi:bifunctional DNase/RNase
MKTQANRIAPLSALLVVCLLGSACSEPPVAEIEVEVSRVALDPNSKSPVVLLEDKAHTVALPIWIGPAEAQSIAMRLEGIDAPRPLTHDLMKSVLDRLGVTLRRVVIEDLRDATYYARIVLVRSGEEVEIDSRPSDAIALAVRFGQPIFVSAALLEGQNAIDLRGTAAAPATMRGLTVQALSDALADHFLLPHGVGVLVSDVDEDSGIELMRGDVILEVDGAPVKDVADLRRRLAAVPEGKLSVQRSGSRIHVRFPRNRH